MDAKFDFYEVVSILASEETPQTLWGMEGVIVGRVQVDEGVWEYAVQMSADNNNCWQLREDGLRSEGRKRRREDLYSGETIRVRVDPMTGEGSSQT
jgi:hypothetical protein